MNIAENVEIEDQLVPALITQPFIENAIWHGLLPLENKRKARLTISISEQNECVFIEIEDNGVGRISHKNQTDYTSKGTKLVMDKIESINKLLKGNDYKLEIVDLTDVTNNPCGTKIIIQLKNSKE